MGNSWKWLAAGLPWGAAGLVAGLLLAYGPGGRFGIQPAVASKSLFEADPGA